MKTIAELQREIDRLSRQLRRLCCPTPPWHWLAQTLLNDFHEGEQ